MEFLKAKLRDWYDWPDLPKGKLDTTFLKDVEEFPWVDDNRKVGIEVEVENITAGTPHNRNFWYIKEDGSLRNHGYEYISVPIKGREIEVGLHQLMRLSLPANADFSDRTSIHVHVNARDLTLEHILNIICLYLVFERLLYKFAGGHRYQNIFCVPIQETKLPIALGNFIVNENIQTLIKEWNKYSGMNLLPLKSQGTIEFRHMEGNRDIPRILNWINLLLSIFKFARDNSFRELHSMIKKLNSNSFYDDFAYAVFKKNAHLLMGNGRLQNAMEHGVSTVKAVSMPSPFLQNLFKIISNDSPLLRSMGIAKTAVIGNSGGIKIEQKELIFEPGQFINYGIAQPAAPQPWGAPLAQAQAAAGGFGGPDFWEAVADMEAARNRQGNP